MHACVLSHIQLSATPWTITCQASLPMGLSQQEYWSALTFPSPRDFPDPGINADSFLKILSYDKDGGDQFIYSYHMDL